MKMSGKAVDIEKLPYRKGVGVMLLNARGEVLVASRIDMPSQAWQMPQGGIAKGEKPKQAALRELREEIGTDNAEIIAKSKKWRCYDLPPWAAAKVWKGRFRGQKQKWFALRFLGSDSEIDLKTEHPEFLDWKWVEMARLPELIVPFKRQVYLDVVSEFAHLAGLVRREGKG